MGLDMYLERMPRYKNATAKDVNAVTNYIDWIRAKDSGSEYANCTFEEWCGIDKVPCEEYIEFYSQFYAPHYSDWDKEHKHPWMRITEKVGYWRKANSIHNWFVKNIQDNVDDCDYHREVTKYDLMNLLNVCKRVLNSCELVDGKICNGYEFKNGNRISIIEDGKYIKDSSIAEEFLPATSGFFFGSTDYDEYYIEDIKNTVEIIKNVLETTDFETEMVYYVSSW